MPRIRRALISVSDKRGLIEFARALKSMGVEIISTGGTLTALAEEGIAATPVSRVTSFPEILDGRVKTLHPGIHGGLLAIADNPKHVKELQEHGIESIDMVVVNLYPFEETIARNGISLDEAIEQIDIGGPAMIRSAAKNFRHKAVVIRPDQYPDIIKEMESRGGCISEETCMTLAREVFRQTSSYDAVIEQFLTAKAEGDVSFPALLNMSMRKEQDLRYGENPHQRAALYGRFTSFFQALHGKELSYNNIVDITAAASLVAEFDTPAVAIIKHTNPCGVATGSTVAEAFNRALATDPKSAFGGIIASNRPLDQEAAEGMNALFSEVIVAPGFPSEVLDLLRKKKDRRLVKTAADLRAMGGVEFRSVPGGVLAQQRDTVRVSRNDLRVVTHRNPSENEVRALLFAWRVAKHVKSNAIVYATGDRAAGIGAGQMSRVDASRIAAQKAAEAGLDLQGTVVASDAFFPFADGLLEAVNVGATAVIQPGGSVRDEEVIDAANAHNLAMVFTGIRHFKH